MAERYGKQPDLQQQPVYRHNVTARRTIIVRLAQERWCGKRESLEKRFVGTRPLGWPTGRVLDWSNNVISLDVEGVR